MDNDEQYTAEELCPDGGWNDARIASALDKAIQMMLPPREEGELIQYRATIRIMRRAQIRLAAIAANIEKGEKNG